MVVLGDICGVDRGVGVLGFEGRLELEGLKGEIWVFSAGEVRLEE